MSGELSPTPVWTRSEWFVIAGLMLLGLVLRLPGLNQGLWFDEILTLVKFVRLPAEEIVNQFYSLNNHVLYTLGAHFSTQWFGESAWSLRLPAVIFAVCTIPAIYHLGRQITSRQEALLATVFLVCSYHHVWFSQNARGYTGLILGAVLGSILFIRLIRSAKPQPMVILAYAVVAALATWIHLTAISLIIAHALIWSALLIRKPQHRQTVSMVGTGSAILLAVIFVALLYAPLLQGLIEHFTPASVDPEIDAVEIQTTWKSAAWVLNELMQGINKTVPGGWPVLLVVMTVLVAGVVSYLKQGLALAGILLLPSFIILAVIFATNQILYPRFLLSAMPFLLLIGVRGGFVLAALLLPFLSRRQVLIIGMAVALVSLSQVPAAWKPKQDFESVVEFLDNHRKPDDAVSCLTYTYLPLVKYWGLDCEKLVSLPALDRAEEMSGRSWIIYTLPTPTSEELPEIWKRIHAEYKPVKKFKGSLNGGDITVMSRQGD